MHFADGFATLWILLVLRVVSCFNAHLHGGNAMQNKGSSLYPYSTPAVAPYAAPPAVDPLLRPTSAAAARAAAANAALGVPLVALQDTPAN